MYTNLIIYDLTQFVLKNKTEKDAFELFNKWCDEQKYCFDSYSETVWIIQYIEMLLNTDTPIIEESLLKDKNIIEGTF
jgi:hypothetical protein